MPLNSSILDSLQTCLLCNDSLPEKSTETKNTTTTNKNVFKIQSKNIFRTFCSYTKLKFQPDFNSKNLQSKTLPFCDPCSFQLYKLHKFTEEKLRLERHIQLILVGMSVGMMELLEEQIQSQEDTDPGMTALRAAAVKCWNPTLTLTRWGEDLKSRRLQRSVKSLKSEFEQVEEFEEMSVHVDPGALLSVSDYESEAEKRKAQALSYGRGRKRRNGSKRSWGGTAAAASADCNENEGEGNSGGKKPRWIRKTNQEYLYNGVTYLHVGDGYECKGCGEKVKNIRGMIAHIQAAHKNERRLKFEKRVEESGHTKGFQKNLWIKKPNQEYVYSRVRYCHVGDGYECRACGGKCGNIRAMKKHIQTEHRGVQEVPPRRFDFILPPKAEGKPIPGVNSAQAGASKASQIQKKWIRKEYQQYIYNKIVYCHVGDGYQCGWCGVKCKNIRGMKKHIQLGHKTGILQKRISDVDETSNSSSALGIPAPVKTNVMTPNEIKTEKAEPINPSFPSDSIEIERNVQSEDSSNEADAEDEFFRRKKPRRLPRVRGENQKYKYNGVIYQFANNGYDCKACGAKGRNIRAMKKHIQLVHTPTQTMPKLEEMQVSPDKYEYEGFGFEKVGPEFRCSSCVFSQESCPEIVGHIRECHIAGNDHLMEVRPGEFLYAGKYSTLKIGDNYVCGVPECKYETKSLRGALIHVRRSHIGDPKEKCICEICGKAFAYPKILQRHLKNHPRLSLDCKYCGKKCPGQYCLKVHELTHEGDAAKKLQCHICGKKFLFRQQLIGHEAAHAGEKNHQCPECGKRFLWQSSLSTHRKAWHSNHSEFSCEVCGATFRYKDSIRRHILGVHKGFTSADPAGHIPTYVRKRSKRSEALPDQKPITSQAVARSEPEQPPEPLEQLELPSEINIEQSSVLHQEQFNIPTETVNVDFNLWG